MWLFDELPNYKLMMEFVWMKRVRGYWWCLWSKQLWANEHNPIIVVDIYSKLLNLTDDQMEGELINSVQRYWHRDENKDNVVIVL